MNFKAVAEIIQSDIKVNIFLEDEKEKHYNETNSSKEESKLSATSKDIQSKEVKITDDGSKKEVVERDVEKGLSGRGGKENQKRANQRQQPTWVQFNTGYGGGADDYKGHGARLYYDEDRNYFVKFVFVIVLIMLTITAVFDMIVIDTPSLRNKFADNDILFLIFGMAIMIPLNYVIFCSECARRPPCNFLCLIMAVVGMTILVAAVTCRYRTILILYAVLVTMAVVAVCIALACTRFDFTSFYLYVIGIVIAFAVLSTIVTVAALYFNLRHKPLHIAMLFIGTILNVIVLIMELQMILGGGSIAIGENDYTIAAYMLYTSIIDVFLKIIQIMGMMDD